MFMVGLAAALLSCCSPDECAIAISAGVGLGVDTVALDDCTGEAARCLRISFILFTSSAARMAADILSVAAAAELAGLRSESMDRIAAVLSGAGPSRCEYCAIE